MSERRNWLSTLAFLLLAGGFAPTAPAWYVESDWQPSAFVDAPDYADDYGYGDDAYGYDDDYEVADGYAEYIDEPYYDVEFVGESAVDGAFYNDAGTGYDYCGIVPGNSRDPYCRERYRRYPHCR